jgi:hypothetical protein
MVMTLIMSSGGQGLGITLIFLLALADASGSVPPPQAITNFTSPRFDVLFESDFLPALLGRESGKVFLPRPVVLAFRGFFEADF